MVFKGRGLVWYAKSNSALRFDDGLYETDDPEKIDYLIALGYEHEGELPVKAEAAPATTTKRPKKGQA